jgi:hypothetical protein
MTPCDRIPIEERVMSEPSSDDRRLEKLIAYTAAEDAVEINLALVELLAQRDAEARAASEDCSK